MVVIISPTGLRLKVKTINDEAHDRDTGVAILGPHKNGLAVQHRIDGYICLWHEFVSCSFEFSSEFYSNG